MVDMFDVLGIIQFGIAGNANSSLSIGDGEETNRLGPVGFITEELFAESGRINVAQMEYLFNTSGVSSVEMESVAVVMASICNIINGVLQTCVWNGLPVIVFRGLSDLAGGQQGQNAINVFGPLAALNAAKAVIQFIDMLPVHVSSL
ncbi:hypothetical protein MKX01_036262 [Papaver californicum]|nr:hypothetical protein MKX01_036262 [Papaver californicum]